MQHHDPLTFLIGKQTIERVTGTLTDMDRSRLVTVLVDGQYQAAVQQFLVNADRCCRENDRGRAGHFVSVRHKPTRRVVLPRRRDRQPALRLQQLERVSGRVRSAHSPETRG